jgi:hypothetical protein
MDWLPDVLRDAGLHVEVEPGWATRGAPTMNPRGVIAHHTASSPKQSNRSVFDLLVRGRVGPLDDPKVPGPLCHLALTRAGGWRVIATGKANHAGVGAWRGVTSSIEMIGIEALNWGNTEAFPTREPWPAVQLDAYDRGVAAILHHVGADESMLCGHREWALPPGRKPDPSGIDMDAMRRRVATLLEGDTMQLGPGDSGPAVKVYQEALNKAIRANGMSDTLLLTVDGVYGTRTESTVRAYQTAASLPASGRLDDLTRDLLDLYIPRR